MKSLSKIAIISLLIVCFGFPLCFAATSNEQLTITTYYPSPSGSFFNLWVANSLLVGPENQFWAPGRIHASGGNAELSFGRRNISTVPYTYPNAGERFVWYNPDGTARLWTPSVGDLLKVDTSGNVYGKGRIKHYLSAAHTNGCLMLNYGSNSWITNCPTGSTVDTTLSPAASDQGGIFFCCS